MRWCRGNGVRKHEFKLFVPATDKAAVTAKANPQNMCKRLNSLTEVYERTVRLEAGKTGTCAFCTVKVDIRWEEMSID